MQKLLNNSHNYRRSDERGKEQERGRGGEGEGEEEQKQHVTFI